MALRRTVPSLQTSTGANMRMRPCCCQLLPSHDDHRKTSGNNAGAGTRILSRGCWTWAELGGDQVDAVSRGVVGHGAGAALGGQGLDGRVIGRRRVDHGQNAFAAGGEGQLVRGIPARGVGAVADGRGCDDLPVLASTTAIFLPSQTGKSRWPGASKARPLGESQPVTGHVAVSVLASRVEPHDLALVFDVVEDRALAVDGGKLGLAGQRNGGRPLCAWLRR